MNGGGVFDASGEAAVGTPKLGVGGLEDVEALADTKYAEDKVVGILVDAESVDDKAVADLASLQQSRQPAKNLLKPLQMQDNISRTTLSLSR
jgi:hypothetical protein